MGMGETFCLFHLEPFYLRHFGLSISHETAPVGHSSLDNTF